jgi:uncharacterized membrane protein
MFFLATLEFMNKAKWLLGEIDGWQREGLIGASAAEGLKARYALRENAGYMGYMAALFSILAALLIGGGIILILAKNWQHFSLSVRVGLAFLPLLLSQALAVFVLKRKSGSLAWREPSAILVAASVFTVIAMVGQIFHLPGDFATYLLTCALLFLPMIYILNAAAPLLMYYWAVLYWGGAENSPINALFLLGLFALGAFFVYLKRSENSGRLAYMAWLTAIAGLPLVLVMGSALDCDLPLAALCYFVMLLAFGLGPKLCRLPFNVIGAMGALGTAAVLTNKGLWPHPGHLANTLNIGGAILAGALLIAAAFFVAILFKINRQRFLLASAFLLLCCLRFAWALLGLAGGHWDIVLASASNLILFSVGLGLIVNGIKRAALLRANLGMAVVCALIVMRFFDSGLDFFWRGIAFVAFGALFIFANIKISSAQKAKEGGVGS